MRSVAAWLVAGMALAQGAAPLEDVRIRILSTMLSDSAGVGEWGFAAVVEAGGRRILFDTGARPETVWKNTQEMKVDLSGITDVILSHNHGDHTGGLITLRRELGKVNAKALTRAHVGKGAFYPRPGPNGAERNHLLNVREEYLKLGGSFVEYDGAKEIFPGAWLTGPVERVHPERNWSGGGLLVRPGGEKVEDNLPEDMSLVLDTVKGLVVVSGCGHAGIINTLEQARRVVRKAPVHAAIGGWHLFAASDEHLGWTGGKMKEMGVENFVGAHCTGIEAVYELRRHIGLKRRNCVVGGVGASFGLKEGILAGVLAR
ncbi:MAG: MBL fold metallo-hydrolase [Acidobacteria bacterium]|nr:MBL fold metallo-hydrolase [Acidobacteriota bacterium]